MKHFSIIENRSGCESRFQYQTVVVEFQQLLDSVCVGLCDSSFKSFVRLQPAQPMDVSKTQSKHCSNATQSGITINDITHSLR